LSLLETQMSWADRLAGAKRGDDSLWIDSQNWCTCAVGEKLGFPDRTVVDDEWLCDKIAEFAPELERLGSRFHVLVKAEKFAEAVLVYEQIRTKYNVQAEWVKEEIDKEYYDCITDDWDPSDDPCDCDKCRWDES